VGFWDAGIGDLEGMGVAVTDEQRDVLLEGGEVLFIGALLSPWYRDGDTSPMLDQDGEVVYVAQQMTVSPGDFNEEEISELDNTYNDSWREWPSYVGTVQERSIDQRPWMEEETWYVRIWDGTPIEEGNDDIAARIFRACSDRINDSIYQAVCEFESSDEWFCESPSTEELMPFVAAETTMDETLEHFDGYDPDETMSAYNMLHLLLTEGYITVDENGLLDGSHAIDAMFKPMAYYLRGDPEALQVWNRLITRREITLEIIEDNLPTRAAQDFDRYERST
jgi:hypothetical protein